MRTLLAFALGTVAATVVLPASAADVYPSGPVTLIAPFPPGGPGDVLAREIARHAGKRLGRQVIVENVAGAAGRTGTARAAKASPDGYTISMGTIGTHVANVALYRTLPYDPVKDFEPVTHLGGAPLMLVASPSLAVGNFAEFVDHARRSPAKLRYGTAGPGSIAHLGCLVLLGEIKAEAQQAPYKGVAIAMTDLLAGKIDLMCAQSTTALPHVRSGKLKALAALVAPRMPVLPDLVTAAESGFPAVDVRSWNGVFAPKGTPDDVVARLHAAFAGALQDAEFRRAMEPLGLDVPSAAGSTPEALKAQLAGDLQTLVPLIRSRQEFLD